MDGQPAKSCWHRKSSSDRQRRPAESRTGTRSAGTPCRTKVFACLAVTVRTSSDAQGGSESRNIGVEGGGAAAASGIGEIDPSRKSTRVRQLLRRRLGGRLSGERRRLAGGVRLLEAHLHLELREHALSLELAGLALVLDAVDVEPTGGDFDGGLGLGRALPDLVQILVAGGGGAVGVELGDGRGGALERR